MQVTWKRWLMALTLATTSIAAPAIADDAKPLGPDPKQFAEARNRAMGFLKSSQADDGNWTSSNALGITALVVTALVENGTPTSDPTVIKGLAAMQKAVRPDGGIYEASSGHKNYETCVALMAFKAANDKGQYTKLVADADKFLRNLQWDESEGVEKSDLKFGGAGYGRSQRPDLSNTQFLLDALKAAGAGPDDQNIQKALVFVSRSQNLESEHNTTPFASKINDGGFFYTPAGGGNSPAGTTDNGGLRSYAAMTYAGLKSMIYAGLTSSDPRVKAAQEWIRKHYSVTENPGMGQSGLLYYYHTFAKTMDVLKVDQFEDAAGKKHDWRKELTDQLFATQRANGSWFNGQERWLEGDPNLGTAYALLALQHCAPQPSK